MATDVFSAFKSQYQYRIAGVFNTGFSNLSRAINNDDTAARLKSRLTSNTIQVNQIKSSGAPAEEISKKVGQTQQNYLRTASQALYDVRSTTERLRESRASLGNLTKDLEASVTEYLKSTSRTAAEDALFKSNTEYILRKLSATYTIIRGRSAADGNTFDINLYQADRRIDSLRLIMNDFPPAGAAEPAPAAATVVEGGDDGTINGTTAATGQTLDVSA